MKNLMMVCCFLNCVMSLKSLGVRVKCVRVKSFRKSVRVLNNLVLNCLMNVREQNYLVKYCLMNANLSVRELNMYFLMSYYLMDYATCLAQNFLMVCVLEGLRFLDGCSERELFSEPFVFLG
jgi:hypothetical protein